MPQVLSWLRSTDQIARGPPRSTVPTTAKTVARRIRASVRIFACVLLGVSDNCRRSDEAVFPASAVCTVPVMFLPIDPSLLRRPAQRIIPKE
jgi:hypothetical protein